MQINRQTISTLLIIIIFSSGLAIFIWNKIQGKDLSQPPNFDLSVYDNFELDDELNKLTNDELQKIMAQTPESETEKTVEAPVEVKESETLEKGYIYFRDSFRANTVEETNDLIKSFLKDFPELLTLPVENFETTNKIKVSIPALSREEILTSIKTENSVLKVEVLEAPIWTIEFKDFLETAEIDEFIKKYPELVRQEEAKKIYKDYVARVKIPVLEADSNLLEKLQKEYSDVLEVVF